MTGIAAAARLPASAAQLHLGERACSNKTFTPEIEPQLGAMASDVEGCLSFPGLRISVTRPTRIVANFQSEFGQPRHVVYTDQDARKFLHEFDHLYGLTLYGRAERAKERGAFVQVGERMRIADGRI